MKIVHLIHSLRGGGIQNFILSLAPEQVKTKNDVTVIVIDKYDSDYCYHLHNLLTEHNAKVIKLNKIRGSKLSLIKAIRSCQSYIKAIKPDIINTHSEIAHLYGGLISICTNTPQVITVHNAPEIWNNVLKIICKNKPLIFCSQAAFKLRQQESKLMTSIDNGISRDIIHSNHVTNLRKEFNLEEDNKVIILAGSLRPQKNYHFLIDIIQNLSNNKYHFFICGGGKIDEGNINPNDFKQYNNIHFLGLRSDVSAIENGADLFLSCAKFEGLPIAVLEAYFNGIPCVLSPIEQHKKIAGVAKVWIPNSFTGKEFVRSINEALNCTLDHDTIYQERKKQIEYYSIERTANKYMDFYKKVIENEK